MSTNYSPFERDKKERKKIIDATMGPPTENKPTGYRTKHTVINKLPMHLGTLERKRRRRQFSGDEGTEEDYSDIGNALGFRPASVTIVGTRDYETQ